MVQLSHPYMTTGKTIALTIQTLVSKVMSLLFNTLSRFVMGFPGGADGKESDCSVGDPDSVPGLMAAVTIHSDFGAQENKTHCFHLFPIYFP